VDCRKADESPIQIFVNLTGDLVKPIEGEDLQARRSEGQLSRRAIDDDVDWLLRSHCRTDFKKHRGGHLVSSGEVWKWHDNRRAAATRHSQVVVLVAGGIQIGHANNG
jgi:hypothetical protein